ncbi:MerR family transcriptional regulator [Mogibacterium kristiansenii]|uniref:MerR family transcriptional regulator n=1 Tax=Mogibacterium kristiansenii TaxID=2606708 RepID=A0A6N7XJS0_9FIRM|nr:MerR family transcriptional regulator [Mogibacterium kristiansenii]MST71458.1 MerR family transcriptional regulator [Mogibacterium kristiansenii]
MLRLEDNAYENGYRDFSDEDVKIINRIKTLRMLDVPIPEIKKLFDGDVQLEAVLEERLSEMNLQAKVLDNRMESCRRIIKEGMELVDISPEVLSGNREEWSEKLRHIVDEDIDKRFILKGVAFTTAFAVCVKFTVVVLTMGGFSQQDTVFCFFGGMLAILCGFVYIFAEALTKQDFLYAWGKNWGGSGMGGLANSYSILGIGVGLAGTTWPLWGGLLIACIALSAIIRMVLMHVIKEAERQK